MTRLFKTFGVLVALTAAASADVSPADVTISSFNPEDAIAPVSTVEGPGVKVGEGTVLRPVFGAESGIVSNVFYRHDNPVAAGILRLIAQVGTASLGTDRLSPSATTGDDTSGETNLGELQYRANLRLSYDFLFAAGDDAAGQDAADTGGLGIGASFKGMVYPMGTWSFGFDEDFQRLIRAANWETDANTNRDVNRLRLLLNYHPASAITGYLYYDSLIDVFERSAQQFADRWSNRIGVHPQWRFLPNTQAYLDLSWGNVGALGTSSTKTDSYPLVLRAGLATLLSLKTTLNLDAGYTNGFYASGPNFSAPTVGASIGYRYSPLGHVALGYTLTYQDSINANYYRDHVIWLTAQQLYNPIVFMVQPEVHFRQYVGVNEAVPTLMGPDVRNDVIFSVVGGMHYNFRNWAAATLDYRFTAVSTDYMYSAGGSLQENPGFVRHELLAGVRFAL